MDRIEPTLGDEVSPPQRGSASRVESRSPASVAAVVIVVALLAIAAATYSFWPRGAPPPPPAASSVPAEPKLPVAERPRHPVTAEADATLPTLKESDGPVAAALGSLIGLDAFARIFMPEDLVRKIVAAVDNLPREGLSQRVNPLRPVPGLPATTGKDPALALAPANSLRYAFYMRVLESVSTEKLAAFYRRHYPLFQEAYEALGYPNAYFNDRLVWVIDHLLETPDTPGPIMLRQPKVLYEFADPTLEERSAGQKILLRIGKENRDKVKVKLREIRAGVAA